MAKKSFLNKKMMKIILLVVVLAVGVFFAVRHFRKSGFTDPEPQCAAYRQDGETTDFYPDNTKFINWLFCDVTSKNFFKNCHNVKNQSDWIEKFNCYDKLSQGQKEDLQDLYCGSASSPNKQFGAKNEGGDIFKCVVEDNAHHLETTSHGGVSHNNRHTHNDYHFDGSHEDISPHLSF